MKKLILSALLALTLSNGNVSAQKKAPAKTTELKVSIDLNQVKEDKVMVTITPPKFTSNEIVFHIPKTVPGTYSYDNYGKLIDDLKAYDSKGKEIATTKSDDNSWTISKAKALAKVTSR